MVTSTTIEKALQTLPRPRAKAPRLKEMVLPAGDIPSISIDWHNNGSGIVLQSKDWLSQGYDGLRIIGQGISRTSLRSTSWEGITVACGIHPGIVRLENLSLYAGFRSGTHFGEQNVAKRLEPKFKLEVQGVDARVLPPEPGKGRTLWLFFSYQADVHMVDVTLDATEAAEHADYKHGVASTGALFERCTWHGSGGENSKTRSDASETAWAGPGAWLVYKACSFKNWYQTWSNRGGGGVVVQGGAMNVLLEDCLFYGGAELGTLPASQRSKCLMVSSEGNSYDAVTGRVGAGIGNGFVVVRRCGMRGGPGPSWYSTMMRVGRNGGSQLAARGVLIEDCGIWGDHESVQLTEIPAGKTTIRGCNTPEIRDLCEARGMDTTYEARLLPSPGPLPLSVGIQR